MNFINCLVDRTKKRYWTWMEAKYAERIWDEFSLNIGDRCETEVVVEIIMLADSRQQNDCKRLVFYCKDIPSDMNFFKTYANYSYIDMKKLKYERNGRKIVYGPLQNTKSTTKVHDIKIGIRRDGRDPINNGENEEPWRFTRCYTNLSKEIFNKFDESCI